jgi:serine/threonine protein kinase
VRGPGDDLAEANEIALKAHCKKVAKRHQELDWDIMRRRLLSARDRALGMGHMERVGPELRYDLSKRLGRQGCQVWEGKLKDGRTCAVKQVDSIQGQKESELLTRITSAGACAHIITYYNFEAAPDGRMFLAMELADQGTLADWKASGRLEALDWAGRKAVGHELCSGLAFLHDTASIVHRDLKPENLLFKSETGRGGERVTLKIADFGLSRSINHSRSRRDTSSGGVGTDCWMPPEGLQGHGGGVGDTASLTFSYDVHPAGSLLYYVLCAGVHAFPGRNDVERNHNILRGRQHKRLQLTERATLTVGPMEQTEALHIVAAMLHVQPEERRPVAALLRHPWWLEPTARMDEVCRLCNDKAGEWEALQGVLVPAVWQ